MNCIRIGVVIGALAGAVYAQPTSVVHGPHNLSAGGPGAVRATMENQVCIFCHAPHNASSTWPLWNRSDPIESYSIYSSRALDALPGQPTGSTKMCLSCHDGTIALGSVASREAPIPIAGGVSTIPSGASNLGTDLRDDHPVSFRYDGALASKDLRLQSPGALPHEVRLDANAELQCTTCHDAHDNSLGHFLVKRNDDSQLCLSCHKVGQTSVAGHQRCADCHQPHTAPSGPYLLRRQTITRTCLACHDGHTPGAADVAADLTKFSVHDTDSPVDAPDPQVDHATCTSCHEPHTMGHGASIAPMIQPSLGRVSGVNASGSPVVQSAFEYEACFKCHTEGSNKKRRIPRRAAQNNVRLEFSPSAVSFHPIAAVGRNPRVPSLRPGWTASSIIRCSDCHASDAGKAAGTSGAGGVHGSNHEPLLAARYETADFTSESASAYALCYQCHDRANILDNASFPGHRRHIVDEPTTCATCHDAHGIASGQGSPLNNSHLMNFATNIVLPDPVTGRLEFRDMGSFRGECFLSCHGVAHSPKSYPEASQIPKP
jgi:predicted CXXCH cytochrome family protein